MAKLTWDNSGSRFFEAGVDRGVLYPINGGGVSWNGLIAVSEKPSGGEATPYYMDGIKYLNVSSVEEFAGSIEAYTYPDEFAECDGTQSFDGLEVHQQERTEFNFSYRTLIGNDLNGSSHGYKIHLVYNALAAPSQNTYGSLSENVEAVTFSWEFTTRPSDELPLVVNSTGNPVVGAFDKSGLNAFSHVTVDSTKTSPVLMWLIENTLYGTETTPPSLLTLRQLFDLYENPPTARLIDGKPDTGLSRLLETMIANGDLIGSTNTGMYSALDNSHLIETNRPGLFILEE